VNIHGYKLKKEGISRVLQEEAKKQERERNQFKIRRLEYSRNMCAQKITKLKKERKKAKGG